MKTRSLSFLSFILLVLLLLCSELNAVMMTSTKIAYVDIERVYNESKGVEAARVELENIINDRKKKISDAEKAVEGVRKNINKTNVVKPAAAEYETPVSTNTDNYSMEASTSDLLAELPAVEQPEAEPVQKTRLPSFEVEEMEKSLAETEQLIDDLVEETKDIIIKKENELRTRLLAKIYDAIKKIALEEGYSVIVDKDVIYYSEKTVEDITDRVIRSLNED